MSTRSKSQQSQKTHLKTKKNRNPEPSANGNPTIDTEAMEATHCYFWKENHPKVGYLSQWYYLPFYDPEDVPMEKDGKPVYKTYQTAEHYMMHHKALLFGNEFIGAEILQTTEPKSVKALGRAVANFDEKTWNAHRERIVERGNYCKFTYPLFGDEMMEYEVHGRLAKNDAGTQQEKQLHNWELGNVDGCSTREAVSFREVLIATGDKVLVEASPFDKIWGIGFRAEEASKAHRHWGLNLLGKCLMIVREQFNKEAALEREALNAADEGDRKPEDGTV